MATFTRRRLLVAAAFVTVAAAGGGLYALHAAPNHTGAVFAVDGVAIRGYDPVAYFTEGRPLMGDPAHSAEYMGAEWHFASDGNRAAFVADPQAYAPQYGGYCAWAVAAKDAPAPIDPTAWKVVDGKLYLNYDHDIQALWEEDVPGFIVQGDANWPGVKARLAAES